MPHDIPPYMLAAGSDNPTVRTINVVGMRRKRISSETIQTIKRAHRLIFREHKKLDAIHDIFRDELGGVFPYELTLLLNFVERQQKGKMGRAREGLRDQPAEATDDKHRRAA